MKKAIFAFAVCAMFACAIINGAFVPMFPPTSCNNDFHPHLDQFGGKPDEVVKVLDMISKGEMEINVWAADASGIPDLARVIVTFGYKGQQAFLTLTSNPTLFFPGDQNYINRQTKGLTKVTSKSGLDATRKAAGCLRDSYSQLVGVKAPNNVQVPVQSFRADYLILPLTLGIIGVIGFGLFLKTKTA